MLGLRGGLDRDKKTELARKQSPAGSFVSGGVAEGAVCQCWRRNTFFRLDKYIFQIGKILFQILTNTSFNLNKYNYQREEPCNVDRNTYISQFGQIYFLSGKNTFVDWKN